ncbi:MAG TPA: DnaA/Hda family protein, partial [Syntrophales bacterium]|nr:DnaA/Hda family protein [Syntrophales bacterium]
MESAWKKALESLRGKINIQLFETWIQPIRILGMSGKAIELSVPNRFFRDWIEENYLQSIREALSTALGTEVEIRLVVGASQESQGEIKRTRKTEKDDRVPSFASGQKLSPRLNVNYSFDRFVVGSCNQFAHAASVAVAKQPARIYNPLFIYGGVGLGKTHLLNAVGLQTLNLYPEKTVLYLSAEEFMNELIYSIRYDRMTKFRDKYRKIDSLLIDDIQFIAGKERTQEEFFHTFNSLHDSGKQIVVTSDRFPKDIQ